MKISHSHSAEIRESDPSIARAIASVSEDYLRRAVETIAIPRHAVAESANNRRIAGWIASELESFGYQIEIQGHYGNIVAFPRDGLDSDSVTLVGAHYDSVPGSPGADDNASAVAAVVGAAHSLIKARLSRALCFVAFNREEDGFLGSDDFVREYLARRDFRIDGAHILEMIGYASDEPGSQMLPPMLPVDVPQTGNFLGVLGNSNSTGLVDSILSAGKSYLPAFHVIGLKLSAGAERVIPNMMRSDHVSFWRKGIPAVMWTDTADFRNPNYHRRTDTPASLNYEFLARVTKLLVATTLSKS